MSSHVSDRRFPIGPFPIQNAYSVGELQEFIQVIMAAPRMYRELVEVLSDEDLARTYREGSWNVRQLVHHVADIQYLHYFRMKKVLTEPDYTTITLINMDGWAATSDSLTAPVEDSLQILDGVHARYAILAGSLSESQLGLKYYHPVRQLYFDQKQALAMSAWHIRHHLGHIKLALASK